jgi:hypothetical protein
MHVHVACSIRFGRSITGVYVRFTILINICDFVISCNTSNTVQIRLFDECQIICRVFFLHSANSFFAKCFILDTRQRVKADCFFQH